MNEGYITTSDDVRLYFQVVGNAARTLVIPNGLYYADAFRHLADQYKIIVYDVRNRGRSDGIDDISLLRSGIHNDVDDLEAVRARFGLERMLLLAHSYACFIPLLYAMKHANVAERIVLIGPVQSDSSVQYPPHLCNQDAVLRDAFTHMRQLENQRSTLDPAEFGKRFWSMLRAIYVANPSDADKIDWDRSALPNERNFMSYWTTHLFPSIQNLKLTPSDFARVTASVLIVHGVKDRSAPYGGGRDWSMRLPNARLLTVANAAHAPWIEVPELIFDAIKNFLDGMWPTEAEKVESLEPEGLGTVKS